MDLELQKIKSQLKKSGLPVYETIMNSIHNQIVSGLWPNGTKLPPDKEMAAALGINHLTLAKALNKLKEIGLLSRRRAQGTFVNLGKGDIACKKRVAVVFDDASEKTFQQKLFLLLHQQLEKSGCSMVFFSSDASAEKQLMQLQQIIHDPGMHGCIVWSILSSDYASKLKSENSENFPIVFLDKIYENLDFDYAGFDNFGCGQQIAEEINMAACERVIWIEDAEELVWSSVQERLKGLTSKLNRGIDLQRIRAEKISQANLQVYKTAVVASTVKCAVVLKKYFENLSEEIFWIVYLTENDLEQYPPELFHGFNAFLFDTKVLAEVAVGILNKRFTYPRKKKIMKVSGWEKLRL